MTALSSGDIERDDSNLPKRTCEVFLESTLKTRSGAGLVGINPPPNSDDLS